MSYIEILGKKSKEAAVAFGSANTFKKDEALFQIATSIMANEKEIINVNKKDIEFAKINKKTEAFIDRLTFNPSRIKSMSDGVKEIIALNDPISEVIGGGETKNGLSIVKKRVPLGVIGMIYESRPNVTVDAAALCIKSGNVCILRGGSDAINTNGFLTSLIREGLKKAGISPDTVQLVEDTSRETANEMMKLNQYIDVLIPRGGANLIQNVVNHSTIPVIATGAGNCHIYIDEFADIDMGVSLTDNAKTQRPSVCNSIETLLINKKITQTFLEKLDRVWDGKVRIFGCDEISKYIKTERNATEEDFATEFNDNIIAVKIVEDVSEAIQHINKYSTNHSECIVTNDIRNAVKFQQEINSAAVYVNASTRFTDGNVFGLGAEIGISNQKLHARGPIGLTELTTYKFLVNGNGQIRE